MQERKKMPKERYEKRDDKNRHTDKDGQVRRYIDCGKVETLKDRQGHRKRCCNRLFILMRKRKKRRKKD